MSAPRRDDFFDLGGGSLSAASWSPGSGTASPDAVVGDVYEHPTVGTLACLPRPVAVTRPVWRSDRVVPTPLEDAGRARWCRDDAAARSGRASWLVWVVGSNALAATLELGRRLPRPPWWLRRSSATLVFVTAAGPDWLAAAGARLLPAAVQPGDHPRGGNAHLRLWLAQRVADEPGRHRLAGAALMPAVRAGLGAEGRPRTSTCTAVRR